MSDAQDTQALPVLAEEVAIAEPVPARAELAPQRASALPTMQAAAAAAGGFMAGAAVVGLVSRRHRAGGALAKAGRARGLGRRNRGGAGKSAGPELLQVVGTRTLLLDVHLLGGAGPER